MDGNGSLRDETNSFLKQKDEWRKEIDSTLEKLNRLEKNLNLKVKELKEREERILQREKELERQYVAKVVSKHDVNSWTEEDVFLWIQHIAQKACNRSISEYAQLFVDNNINGKRLLLLTLDDLKALGIQSLGYRLEILDQISRLQSENELMLHFPPLEKGEEVLEDHSLQMVSLTLLFGNHCRIGRTQQDCKWKMYADVDGEDPYLSYIKDVTFRFSTSEPIVLKKPPYVMERWQKCEDEPSPVVECIINYTSDVKKPKCTKYSHMVQLQEGGATYQRTAELTLKQSVGLGPIDISNGSPDSPALSNRSFSDFSVDSWSSQRRSSKTRTMSITSSTTTTPFLSAWERGPASELLFQSSSSRGLVTTSSSTNLRRADSSSPSSKSPKQSPSPSNVKQENRSSPQAGTKGKTSGSPSKQSPFEWTQVKPRRKEENHGKDRNPRASSSGEWRDGGGNYKRSNNKEKGSTAGFGNRQANFAGRNRGKTPNSKFSRSVSDNTNNRPAKQTGVSDETSRKKTASEGGAYRR